MEYLLFFSPGRLSLSKAARLDRCARAAVRDELWMDAKGELLQSMPVAPQVQPCERRLGSAHSGQLRASARHSVSGRPGSKEQTVDEEIETLLSSGCWPVHLTHSDSSFCTAPQKAAVFTVEK